LDTDAKIKHIIKLRRAGKGIMTSNSMASPARKAVNMKVDLRVGEVTAVLFFARDIQGKFEQKNKK